MPRPPRIDPRIRRLWPAALLVVLLCLPGALWLAGERQPLLERRPKEEFPAFNRSSLQDEHTFRRIDTALLDRFPGRGEAVDAHARIGIDLFRDSPNPDVAIGGGGFMYYVPEARACVPGGEPISDPADTVEVLARTFVAAGMNATVMAPGPKQLIHSDDAPELDAEQERCLADLERAMSERLARTPGGVDLDAELRALEADGDATFQRRDTHWNWRGREAFVRQVLDRIRPGLADEAGLRVGDEIAYPGDLDQLVGLDREEEDRAVEVIRTPPRPLPAGDAVLIGDSQMDNAIFTPRGGVRPLNELALPGQTYCNWSVVMTGECDEALRRARTVVLEKVVREVRELTELCWRPLAIAGERIGGGVPARWERVDGGTAPAGGAGALTLPQSGFLRVRVVPAGPQVADVPLLVRVPVQRLPDGGDGAPTPVEMQQEPQAGPPSPCATPIQGTPGGALLLPVPAGRRVSDLVVRLQGAPGTRLGRPQTILLDGRPATD